MLTSQTYDLGLGLLNDYTVYLIFVMTHRSSRDKMYPLRTLQAAALGIVVWLVRQAMLLASDRPGLGVKIKSRILTQ